MKRFCLLLLIAFSFVGNNIFAQRVKKVVLQAYWWDYRNNNFPNKWSDYLTELAPRLKSYGIDAIWVPPSYKCSSTASVGYNPFDQYDLGDKYQKGGGDSLNVRTRMGTKDELLRMIAVMHANGIEVIEDIVLNHTADAGANNGNGGRDPQSPYSIANANGYKNFRYVSYATPLIDESQDDYWTRGGRWAKNYTNFYPNAANNCTTGDICSPYFGPDISYENTAIGQSSNIPTSGTSPINKRSYVNPVQASNYMRDNARGWLMWLKKQTSFDGWRFDAVKHYPIYAQEDVIYNTKYILPAFAKGGEAMFSVGEWIGNKTEIDNYVTAVRSGSEEHTGTFDFSLRGYGPNGGVYSMVMSQGAYNMQNLPGDQQLKRYYDYSSQRVHRTVPFVNNHDTFRPVLDASGNYSKGLGDNTGWNTGSELGGNGQHIDPREPRLYAAYATIFAMDGNPTVYFEDLFDVGTTSKRFSHLPSSTTDLPIRLDILNIINAHQTLGFKNGDYAVPTALTGSQAPFYSKGTSGNHLVIERTNKAIIGITDKYSTVADNSQDEEVWVSVSGGWRNMDLIDYSGAHGLTTTRVYADGRVLIKTAPVSHTIAGARGHGYSVWAPVPAGVTFTSVNDLYNYLANNYQPARSTTTIQEWEMADDLGDSHAKSLKQGGRLPDNSVADRLVGRIYVASGKTISALVYPEVNGRSQTVTIYNAGAVSVATVTGASANTSPLILNYTPAADGWYSIKIKNANAITAGQKVWVNVSYTAPTSVNTRTNLAPTFRTIAPAEPEIPLTSAAMVYPNPTNGEIRLQLPDVTSSEQVSTILMNAKGNIISTARGSVKNIEQTLSSVMKQQKPGLFFIKATVRSSNYNLKLLKY